MNWVEFSIGVFGLLLLIGSPIYLIKKVKTKNVDEIVMGIFLGIMFFLIGFTLIISWLWI